MRGMNTMIFPEHTEEEFAYHQALEAAEAAGMPWFSFQDYLVRVGEATRKAASQASTLPAPPPAEDDDISF